MKLKLFTYLIGGATAAKVMLYLYHYGEAYASSISKDLGVTLSQVQKQLDRFEASGLLLSRSMGRVRIYTFNQRLTVIKKLQELIGVFYDAMTMEQREKMFAQRRRRKRRGKPVIPG